MITQKAFANSYQVKRLLEEFRNTNHKITFIPAENIILQTGKQLELLTYTTSGNIHSFYNYDLYVFREIFAFMKDMITTIKLLKHHNKKVFDNNLTQVGYLNNKLEEAVQLVDNNIHFPKSLHFKDIESLFDNLDYIENYLGGFPIIAKKRTSGKGAGIYKLSSKQEIISLMQELAKTHRFKHKVVKLFIFQEFLNIKKEYRVFVVGNKVLSAMQRIPKPGDFRANFSLGGSVKAAQITDIMQDISLKAHQAVQAEISGVDYAVTQDNQYYILEVNRTPGFKGLEQATQVNIAKHIVNYILQKYT